MGVQINSLDVIVPGNVGRKLANEGKDTKLTVTAAQANSLYTQLGEYRDLFENAVDDSEDTDEDSSQTSSKVSTIGSTTTTPGASAAAG